MRNSSNDRVAFHLEASSEPDVTSTPAKDEPFRIALLGDFSGRSKRGPISERKLLAIDRDNIDAVIQKLNVEIELQAGPMSIRTIEDFHPDHIYGTYPIFGEVRNTRDRLADPETFNEAARDLLGETPAPLPSSSRGSLVDQILGETGGSAARPVRKEDPLQAIVRNLVKPHLVAREDPRAPELIRQVDRVASDLMRAVLHHPKFHAVEAAWKTVQLMAYRLETGAELKIFLLDVSKQELAEQPEAVYDILVKRPDPWAVIAGNYAFGAEDVGLLSILGKIARKAQAPFLGEAGLSLLDNGDDWNEFRSSPEAQHVALALPRVLLRLPYGNETVPCDTFAFEEVQGKPDPKQMLFGSPALFCAMLLGQSFEQEGWRLRPGGVRDVNGLPIYIYQDDGESVAFPCAEIEMTEETAEALIENGFMPMASIRNKDVVRALMFQTVANPPTALRGRWN